MLRYFTATSSSSKKSKKSTKESKKSTKPKKTTATPTTVKPKKQQATLQFTNNSTNKLQKSKPDPTPISQKKSTTIVTNSPSESLELIESSTKSLQEVIPIQKTSNVDDDIHNLEMPSKSKPQQLPQLTPPPQPTPLQPSSQPQLSAYEIARLANIRRNQQHMQSLGLGAAKASLRAASTKPKAKSRKRQRVKPIERDPNAKSMPRRRSKRTRNLPAQFDPTSNSSLSSATSSTLSEYVEPKEEELPFDDSKVCMYETAASNSATTLTNNDDGDDETMLIVPPVQNLTFTNTTTKKLQRITEITHIFQDDALKKIYSMSFSPDKSLLAAVGHGGRASVFGTSGESAGNVLMSFKAHKGWVASTVFLDAHMLLTAANDAVVTIWDLRKVLATGSNQRPRIVCTNDSLHNNGIFCADVKSNVLVTASKDKTVSYCNITESEGIVPVRWLSGLHSHVIKHVRLRDTNILASTGNDCDVCVCDARVDANSGLIKRIENVHNFSTNHVTWNPNNEHVLMTASFGNTIKLWDLRKTSEPIHMLKGHAMLYDEQRGSKIYHPIFTGNGRYVVTPGVKSDALTIYDSQTGELISKGNTSVGEVTSLASCDVMGNRMAACKLGKVVLLDPVWS